jgi:hypothetical protein
MAVYTEDMTLMGLDRYTGEVMGMNPLWGVTISAGASTVVTEGLQFLASGKLADYSEAIGSLIGLISGGVLYGFGHRAAGLSGIAAVLLTRGVSAIVDLFMPSTAEAVADLTKKTLDGIAMQGLSGAVVMDSLSGETQLLSGHGMSALSGETQLLSGNDWNTMAGVAQNFGTTVY